MLEKTKLKNIGKVLSEALIDSNINHDEFALINNMLKEYDHMKEEINSLKTSSVN